MGRFISESTSSGGTITYGYNALNIKEQLTNARGQVRKYFYDALGRITGFVGAEDSVSYTYDDNGNVLTVSEKNGVIKREYDALNRVTKYTDTFGKSICYEYDSVGNLTRLVYPDNTSVTYTYDANKNLVSVTDWQGRVTTYTYDVNNRVIGVVKPDGSVTTTVYDNAQRIVSTVERTASNVVITGFEYTYDNLSRIVEEKHLADNTKICYTYDNLSRVTNRTIKNECDCVISSENFTYDAAGNITDAPNSCFAYETNNRLIVFNGNTVSYDMDGNMLSNGYFSCEFDSANRLIKAGGHTYTYNAEDVRIRNLCSDADTTYTYNTNCKLSQLLTKTTNGTTTKYVYGHGLIGEEKWGEFKTYHFDYRGSTIAITDQYGNITDTFKYDTYGKMTEHIGDSFVILGYNGRDGVVTDKNGLIYMRARYYSPDMRRFINADIISGEISDSTSLNRYSYVNGNPVSFVDPFGLSKDDRGSIYYQQKYSDLILKALKKSQKASKSYYRDYTTYNNIEKDIDDAFSKIISGIEQNSLPGSFNENVKVRIDINPNYNISGDELISELAGFIPVLGELYSIVDFASDEKKDIGKIYDVVVSAVTKKDISKLLPLAEYVDTIGKVVDIVDFADFIETIANWNSNDKKATEINVYIDTNDIAYKYHAVVDDELYFKEMYSGYTGTVIKSEDPNYQINVE